MLTTETKHGIDKTKLMVFIIKVLDSSDSPKEETDKVIDEFKAFIEESIKRKMTNQESLDLYKGLLAFVQSEAGEPERFNALEYLAEAEFLKG